MEKIFLLLAIIATFVFINTADASVRVSGYFNSRGAYINSYYKSSPNSYRFDNYSARGNYNPYTGRKGYTRW